MTQLSEEIFRDYQVRNKKVQKTRFIERLQRDFPDAQVEQSEQKYRPWRCGHGERRAHRTLRHLHGIADSEFHHAQEHRAHTAIRVGDLYTDICAQLYYVICRSEADEARMAFGGIFVCHPDRRAMPAILRAAQQAHRQ